MEMQDAGPVLVPYRGEAFRGVPSPSLPPPTAKPDLPAGYPTHIDHRLAWDGAALSKSGDFISRLSAADLAELQSALDFFKDQELAGDAVRRENFPLPTLGPKLEAVAREIHGGRGFHLIRGVQPEKYSVEDLTIIWLGIQAYIADQRGCQDHTGNMLVHIVADNTTEIKLGHHRHSTSAISFHTEEAGDVVGWLTRSTAPTGGRCVLASVYTIYNILAAHRPDLVRTLARADWPVALPRFQCRPLLFHHRPSGRLAMNFGRARLLGSAAHPRPAHLPTVSASQREALDAVEQVARATQVEVRTRPGDMHFVNNLAVLHRREGFVDGAAPRDKRHLVRMRLRSSNPTLAWPVPAPLQREWDEAFGKVGEEEEGGRPRREAWHLEPMPGDAFPLRKYTN
ncbi:Clavaminate synthase-like protein [Xylariaceae sp. FL0804]|nr:Clavaminate synthase-like protein [Xylariaceae sp. FL0804]